MDDLPDGSEANESATPPGPKRVSRAGFRSAVAAGHGRIAVCGWNPQQVQAVLHFV